MSATTLQTRVRPTVTPDPNVRAVPFGRLLKVELRKLVDTRAGFWLLAAIGVVTVAAVTIFLFAGKPADLTFLNFVRIAGTPQAFLLPVLAILAVTTEWTQRTGLVTFTLEPSRSRVVLAKFTVVVLVGVAAVVIAFGIAAIGNVGAAAFADGSGSWNVAPANIRDIFIVQLIGVVTGFAFGMLLMNTAAAVVLYFVLPLVWNVLFTLVNALKDAAPWLDINTALAPINEGNVLKGEDWSHLAVSGAIWVLLPLALGVLRLLRRELKSA